MASHSHSDWRWDQQTRSQSSELSNSHLWSFVAVLKLVQRSSPPDIWSPKCVICIWISCGKLSSTRNLIRTPDIWVLAPEFWYEKFKSRMTGCRDFESKSCLVDGSTVASYKDSVKAASQYYSLHKDSWVASYRACTATCSDFEVLYNCIRNFPLMYTSTDSSLRYPHD